MEAQFGLAHLWNQGDLVTKAVAILLLAMSLASWIVLIVKALDLRRASGQGRRTEAFWHEPDLASALECLGTEPGNPFRALAEAGREATAHHHAQPQLHDSLDVSDWVTRCLRNGIDDIHGHLAGGAGEVHSTEREAVNANTEFLQSGDSCADIDGITPQTVEFGHDQHVAGFEFIHEADEPAALRDGDAAGDGFGDDAARFDGETGSLDFPDLVFGRLAGRGHTDIGKGAGHDDPERR